MSRAFSIGEAIKFGWSKAKQFFLLFLGLYITYLAIQIVPNFPISSFQKSNPSILIGLISVILSIVIAVTRVIMDLGLVRAVLDVIDGKSPRFSVLFSQSDKFWKYIGATLLYFGIVYVGIFLLIVPGIIWSIKFGYYSYFIVDENLGPVDALKRSAQLTEGVKLKLIGFGLVAVLVNVLGALALLFGLLLTIPTTAIAQGYVYRKLRESMPTKEIVSSRFVKVVGILGFLIIPVIAIIAAVVVLTINPLELTRRGRDAARLTDLANLQQTINVAVQSNPNINLCGNNPIPCRGESDVDSRNAGGSGWVKFDLSDKLTSLPIDPVNSSTYHYTYCSDGKVWQIITFLESELIKKQKAVNPQTGFYSMGSSTTLCQ